MLCDAHVHIGRYKEFYFDPLQTMKELSGLGAVSWAVSSTSTLTEPFNQNQIINELKLILKDYPAQTRIVIWLTPGQERDAAAIKKYENSLPVSAFKIHPYYHNWNDEQITGAFILAENKNKPLIIHTGGSDESDPLRFMRFCEKFKGVKTVLAHGRPCGNTMEVMKRCGNVFADTAFMPVQDVKRLYGKFKGRILFGTDFPIGKYYYADKDAAEMYQSFTDKLVEEAGEGFFNDSFDLFRELFK